MTQTTPAVPDLQNPLALEQQVCFALAVASRNVIAVYRPLLEPLGLTHPQYLVMLAMWEHQPLSVRALSDMLQLNPHAVAAVEAARGGRPAAAERESATSARSPSP